MKFVLFLLFIIIVGNAIYRHEMNLKNRLNQLEDEIKKMSVFKDDSIFTTETPIEGQLIYLEQQAEKLKFCYQCPLYQDKDRQGM